MVHSALELDPTQIPQGFLRFVATVEAKKLEFGTLLTEIGLHLSDDFCEPS